MEGGDGKWGGGGGGGGVEEEEVEEEGHPAQPAKKQWVPTEECLLPLSQGELQNMCRSRGLAVYGRKEQLRCRLLTNALGGEEVEG